MSQLKRLFTGKLSSGQPPAVEEGNFAYYKKCKWYPAAPGKLLDGIYSIITKVGYGAASTVWLCRDQKSNRYVVIKIPVAKDWRPTKEMEILDYIEAVKRGRSDHPGAKLIRGYIGSCQVSSNFFNKHKCIIYSPLGPSLKDVRAQYHHGRIPVNRLKPMIKHMLLALDFLHTCCGMVHTDVHAGNFLMMLTDQASLEHVHRAELAKASVPHESGGHVIYDTRDMPRMSVSSVPIFCDFSCVVKGKRHAMQATPDIMRPPEVILGLPWSEKLDIWCLGLVIWYCVEGRNWYNYKHAPRKRTELEHMAYTFALLGTPSPKACEDMRESKRWSEFFDENAQFKLPALIPRETLMDRELALRDDHEQAKGFLLFISRMLQWNPDCRASAAELFMDPWLN